MGSPADDLVAEVEQRVEDVVGAAQRFGGDCPTHPWEVGIDPPQPRDPVENRLKASLSLAVVDAGAVEYQHGSTGPVLHVVDHHLAHSDLHPRKLPCRGRRDNAASTRAADVGPLARLGLSQFCSRAASAMCRASRSMTCAPVMVMADSLRRPADPSLHACPRAIRGRDLHSPRQTPLRSALCWAMRPSARTEAIWPCDSQWRSR